MASHSYLGFLRTNTLSRIICAVYYLYFRFGCSYLFFLHSLIDSQSAMNGVFSIVSPPKTSWTVVAFSVVWYMLCTSKSAATNIPDQGSSSAR